VFERNEIDIAYAEDIALVERGHGFCLLYYAQIGFLVDYHDAHDQPKVIRYLLLDIF
jgi:hypothetical protein